MFSRIARASFALILAAAATAAVAEGGGIGRAGTYPPQYGPGVPSHADLLAKKKPKAQTTSSTLAADVDSTPEVHARTNGPGLTSR